MRQLITAFYSGVSASHSIFNPCYLTRYPSPEYWFPPESSPHTPHSYKLYKPPVLSCFQKKKKKNHKHQIRLSIPITSPNDTNSDFTKDLQELAYELEKGNEPTVYWKDLKEMRGYHTPLEVNPSKKEPRLVHLQKVYDFIEGMEVIESQLALTEKFSSQNVSRDNFTELWKDNERILKERYPHVNDPAKFEEMQQLYVQWNFMLLLKGGPDEYLEKKCRLRHELKLASNDMVQLGRIATCSYSEEERVQMLMEQWESSTKARRLRLLSGLGFPAGFKIPDKINVSESHY